MPDVAALQRLFLPFVAAQVREVNESSLQASRRWPDKLVEHALSLENTPLLSLCVDGAKYGG